MNALRASLVLVVCAGLSAFGAGCGLAPPRAAFVGQRVIVQRSIHAPISMIDSRTGELITQLGADGYADSVPTDGQLVFMHGDGGLVARDVLTGEVRWRVFTKVSYCARPVVAKKLVFVPLRAGTWGGDHPAWVGFSKQTGEHTFELASDSWAPLVTNDDVLVTIQHGELVGYSADDGKEKWRSTLTDVSAPLVIAGATLYVRMGDELGIFNASSGALRQKLPLGGSDAFSGFDGTQPQLAAIGNSVAWIQDETLFVADGATGKQSWNQPGVDRMVLTASGAVITRDNEVSAYELATGTKKWSLSLAETPRNLVANGEMVAVRVASSEVIVIDAATGKIRFGFDIARGESTAPKKDETAAPADTPPNKPAN